MANGSGSFLQQFIRHPVQIGAVVPSSKRLARKMVEWLELGTARAVVEYGTGTGAFTPTILESLDPRCRFFGIEIDPRLAEIAHERLPGVTVYQDSAANVRELCRKEGIEAVDAVVCGLPWAAFPGSMQIEFMDALVSVLRPGGQFVTFAYLHGLPLPAARRFRRLLPRYFSKVSRSPTVWGNLPPAFVYRCRR